MKINLLSTSMAFLFLLFGCTRDDLDNIDYFVFGDAHGFCQGDCASFYMMKDGRIYPDNVAYYNGTSPEFHEESLPGEKYVLAEKLIDDFPKYLINNPGRTFGCPDCADQGGIHIELMEDGRIKKWHFDTNTASLPSQVRDYVEEVKMVLSELK
jgi:uncharacterized protein YlaI